MLAAVSDARISTRRSAGPLRDRSRDDGGTAFAVTAHHVALDGRPMAQLLFLLARVLVDGDDISGHPLTAPTEPLGRYTLPERDWSTRRAEMLATAREIRDEEQLRRQRRRARRGTTARSTGTATWPTRSSTSTAEQSQALIDWSKANGATVHGALTAVVLKAIAQLAPETEAGAALHDRRPPGPRGSAGGRRGRPVRGRGVGVLRRHGVEPGALAREATADIRRRVDRGEPELFFALSGVDKLPVGEATDKVVRRWMETATPAANLSNLGVVTG